MIEVNYIIHSEETSYRVRPNPDDSATDGSAGIVIEWRDAGEKEWTGYTFIAPNAAMDVARAIALLMTGKPSID